MLCNRLDTKDAIVLFHYTTSKIQCCYIISSNINTVSLQVTSHKPGGKLPLLSARPAVTLTTLKGAATNFAGW